MSLKSTLREQMPERPSSKDEDLKLIQGLNEKLREAEEQIQDLQSQNSMLQLENQELQSKLMIASEQIELLTRRAASVNETELQNRELIQSAAEAKTLRDEARQRAAWEKDRAEAAQGRAERAAAARKEEEKRRLVAERQAEKARGSAQRTKEQYTALFYGIVIFTVTLAVLTAYSHRSVFVECGRWFVDRGSNLLGLFSWLGVAYGSLQSGFSTLFGGSEIVAHGLSIVIFGAVAAGCGVGCAILLRWSKAKVRAIKAEYEDGLLKGILTASITISLFYVCLFLYEPIKSMIPLNIFSVWLLLSLIGAVAVNWREIKGGIERGY